MQPTKYQKLITALKFKTKQNAVYYIVKSDFKFDEQEFKIYKGAMLLNSGIPSKDDDHLYLSVMYKVKPLNGAISIEEAGEGLVEMSFDNLASLIIAKKIDVYYVDINKADDEIFRILENSNE